MGESGGLSGGRVISFSKLVVALVAVLVALTVELAAALGVELLAELAVGLIIPLDGTRKGSGVTNSCWSGVTVSSTGLDCGVSAINRRSVSVTAPNRSSFTDAWLIFT